MCDPNNDDAVFVDAKASGAKLINYDVATAPPPPATRACTWQCAFTCSPCRSTGALADC